MSNTSLTAATILLQIQGVFTKGYPNHTPGVTFDAKYEESLTNGVGANQATQTYSLDGTIDKSGTRDIDLGAATNIYGETIAFDKAKAIFIFNVTNVAGVKIHVGGAASNPVSSLFVDTSDKGVVQNNGVIAWATADADGYAIAEDSADILRLTNTSPTHRAKFKVFVIGSDGDYSSSSSSSYSTAAQNSSSSSSSTESSDSSSTDSSSTDSSSSSSSASSSSESSSSESSSSPSSSTDSSSSSSTESSSSSSSDSTFSSSSSESSSSSP